MSTSSHDDDDERHHDLQNQLIQKELQTTKKLLRESQAKFNLLNTEHSKLQNQHQLLEKSFKKCEQKFKEAIEKLSVEQVKTKELAYINKQLAIDVEGHNHQKSEGFHKVQENFNKLKSQFQDIQGVWERQKQAILDIATQSSVLVKQNSKNLFGDTFPMASSSIAEILQRNLERVVTLLDAQYLKANISDGIYLLQRKDALIGIAEMKNRLFQIEEANNVLRKQKSDLQIQLDNATQQITNLLPKYKEQIDKLQQQLKNGTSYQEDQFREDLITKTRQFESEKETLRNQVGRLQAQLRESEFDRSYRPKSHEKKSSEKKTRSGKKIKNEIKKLDDDIMKLQRSLEQEMGKIAKTKG